MSPSFAGESSFHWIHPIFASRAQNFLNKSGRGFQSPFRSQRLNSPSSPKSESRSRRILATISAINRGLDPHSNAPEFPGRVISTLPRRCQGTSKPLSSNRPRIVPWRKRHYPLPVPLAPHQKAIKIMPEEIVSFAYAPFYPTLISRDRVALTVPTRSELSSPCMRRQES